MTQTEALRLALEALEYEAQKGNDNAYQFERDAIKAALEAKDEPVAWAMLHDNGHFIDAIHPNEHARVEGEYITPLYTTPPQRTWVGLKEEEMEAAIPFGNLSGEYSYDDILNIILLIQAKLRSKND